MEQDESQTNNNQPELIGVEKPAIAWLVKLGYTHLQGKSIKQVHGTDAPLLEHVLSKRLLVLNPWLADIANGAKRAVKLLKDIWFDENSDLMLANQAFWLKVLFQSDLQLKDKDGNPKSIRFIEQTSASENDFHVVDQYVGKNANNDLFKPDLLLFINGMPLGVIECKKSSIKLEKGIAQIDGYINTFQPHFAFNMVCAAINRTAAKYGAIFAPEQFYLTYKFDPNRPEEKLILEEIEAKLGKQPTEQDKLIWALFEPSRFLRLVCFYPIYELDNGMIIKKLPRYQQWRVVEITLARLHGKDPKHLGKQLGGTIWHTQGSGKSLSMVMLARLLRAEVTGFDNPSILILTDRKDLDTQIFQTIDHVAGITASKANSVAGLESMIGNDYGMVFTSTVQKFQERDGKPIKAAQETEDADSDELLKSRVRRVLRKDHKGKDTCWIIKETNENLSKFDDEGEPLKAKL